MKKSFSILLTLFVLPLFMFGQTTTTMTSYGLGAGTQGNYNSFFGTNAGANNTEGANVFVGHEAGYENTTGYANVFMGFLSGKQNTIGTKNTFMGYSSGEFNTTGKNNVFSGYMTGRSNISGNYNTYIGLQAGHTGTSASHNTFVGYQAGIFNVTGGNNTYLGNFAGFSATGSRNVFLGYKAGKNENGSDKLYIDNSDTASPLIWGDFANDIVSVNGYFGIGTSTFVDGADTYHLSVNGKIRAHAVKVYTSWADYVFEDDYVLPTLKEVEEYIIKNGHLKDIPSAKTVEEEGIDVGEMNKLLLQKIEELTLYTIQLKKEIDELKTK